MNTEEMTESRNIMQAAIGRAQAAVMRLPRQEGNEPAPPVKPISDALINYAALLALDLPERPRLIPWLPEGGNAMVHGPRGVGKTFFQLGLATSLTTGKDFLKWKVTSPVG